MLSPDDKSRKEAYALSRQVKDTYIARGGTIPMIQAVLDNCGVLDPYESPEQRKNRLTREIVHRWAWQETSVLLPDGKEVLHWYMDRAHMDADQLEKLGERSKKYATGHKNACNDSRKKAKKLSGREQKRLELLERAANGDFRGEGER